MKRLILLNISLFAYVFCMSQSISLLSKNEVPKIFNIAIIDSITNNEKNHCIWLKNQNRPLVYQNGDVSEIVFNNWNNKYCLFSDEENNIEYGFCFDSGHFGVLIPDTLENNGHFVILGDTLSKKDFIIAHIDTLHLLRNIYDGDFIYKLHYFEKHISIETFNLNTDSIHQYRIDYTGFNTNSLSINTRVSHLTDNRWFQFLNMTSLIIGLRNPNKNSMMCDYASIQDNRFINTVGDLGNIVLSIRKLNLWQLPISFLSFLDKFAELLYYRGASVETLDAKKIV